MIPFPGRTGGPASDRVGVAVEAGASGNVAVGGRFSAVALGAATVGARIVVGRAVTEAAMAVRVACPPGFGLITTVSVGVGVLKGKGVGAVKPG